MQSIHETIQKYGHAIRWVFPTTESDGPPWATTIGLSPVYGYELIVCLLGQDDSSFLLNKVADTLKSGVVLPLDEKVMSGCGLKKGWPAMFKACNEQRMQTEDWVNASRNYYGHTPKVRQFVLTDNNLRLPGERGYNLPEQPLLWLPR